MASDWRTSQKVHTHIINGDNRQHSLGGGYLFTYFEKATAEHELDTFAQVGDELKHFLGANVAYVELFGGVQHGHRLDVHPAEVVYAELEVHGGQVNELKLERVRKARIGDRQYVIAVCSMLYRMCFALKQR